MEPCLFKFREAAGPASVPEIEKRHRTYDIDELAQLELDADAQHVGGVDDGAHQLVVVGQQVVVQPLGVGVAGQRAAQPARRQPEQHPATAHAATVRRAAPRSLPPRPPPPARPPTAVNNQTLLSQTSARIH